ncbi:MAG: molybdopterin-synthase adenylyltransferase MoeB [Magnetococcales bacterium]|nr:molybdopterin-synthase adenylyltransferase MoeB [Magnetococcales bacterium]
MDALLTAERTERFSRQILLREVGGAGQARLLRATVGVVGAGGLGSPAALYLAAAGVGHLMLADADRVELSNLQRQILHTTDRIGQPKVLSARAALQALDPHLRLTLHQGRLDQDSAPDWVRACDLIIDGSDNPATRYLLNRVCQQARKPLIYGSVVGFEGQMAPFPWGTGADFPCYRCLFPHPPDPDQAPGCAAAGLLAPVAGVIGSLQAVEALKILLDPQHASGGRLLLANLRDGVFRTIRFRRDPHCPDCGTPPAA